MIILKKIFTLTLAIICLISYTALARNNIIATYFVVNCRESITLRDEPSTYAYELTQIPLGARVRYLGVETNSFYKVEYRGMVGYVLKTYLELD